jgi:hypothetical protein
MLTQNNRTPGLIGNGCAFLGVECGERGAVDASGDAHGSRFTFALRPMAAFELESRLQAEVTAAASADGPYARPEGRGELPAQAGTPTGANAALDNLSRVCVFRKRLVACGLSAHAGEETRRVPKFL